ACADRDRPRACARLHRGPPRRGLVGGSPGLALSPRRTRDGVGMSVSVHRLTVALDGRPVVRRLSFEAPAGGWFGVLGVNGSGKTTPLRTLAGGIGPTEVAILIEGEKLDRRARGRCGGFMPDQADWPGLRPGGDLVALLGLSRGGEPRLSQAVREGLGVEP